VSGSYPLPERQSTAPTPPGLDALAMPNWFRRRWAVVVLVTLLVMALQPLPAILANRETAQILFHTVFSAFEVPILMVVLSYGYGWSARRRFGSMGTLLTSLLVAPTVVILLGVMVWIGIHSINPAWLMIGPVVMSLDKVVVFCTLIGFSHCGLWALAFVYPFTAEDARLRSLEAEKLKLEAEKLKLEAEKLKSKAELARLRSQLEPHFLLNTLNAIAGLVTREPREARRLLACLGDLLRDALIDADEMQTLDEEIAWLHRYAEILEARHSGSLAFEWEIAREAGGVLVPRLLLQPLVENAVKHGALRRGGGGRVVVRASLLDPGESPSTRVLCTVEDNGPGMPDKEPRSGAFGLRAVRRRLELKYTDAHLRIESSNQGTRCIVELPRMFETEGAMLRRAEVVS